MVQLSKCEDGKLQIALNKNKVFPKIEGILLVIHFQNNTWRHMLILWMKPMLHAYTSRIISFMVISLVIYVFNKENVGAKV
jgi:hypothetical protein